MATGTYARIILINILVMVVVVGLLFGGYLYYVNSTNYVTTSDATVTGTIVPITVPYGGRIKTWNAAVNQTFRQGQVLGEESGSSVLSSNPGLQALIAHNRQLSARLANLEKVTAPIGGTVIQTSVSAGEMVQPGEVLARMVNLGDLNITANIAETEIRHVLVGQQVDVRIDAIPNTTFKGTVQSIGDAATSVFSLVPNVTAASGAFTKVVQRIPVVISLNGGYGGKTLVPGMNAVVSINVNNNS